MQKSNAPTQLTVAFASGTGAGPVNAIPIPASGTAGAASWTTGFTSVNMEPIGSGGIAPFGADFNGLFNALSNAQIWQQSGYLFPYSSAFATAVSGYPAGAALQMASGLGLWINQADSNTTNPDTTASTNWIELCANAGGTTVALSGATVTPTANQLGAPLLILTGALSAACKLVLPLRKGASWKILNNTTGGQTVTVGGSTGSTVTIAAGSVGAQEVFTDGTNFFTTSFNGAGVYLPINGTAVAATAWATPRTITMSGDVVWSVTVDGTSNQSAAGTIQNGAVTVAKMANLVASSLLGNPTGSAASPSAISLISGLTFTGSTLGLGVITPTGINTSGAITSIQSATPIGLTLSNTGSANGVGISLVGNTPNPSKLIRARAGNLEIVNDAQTAILVTVADAGNVTLSSSLTASGNIASTSGGFQAGNGTFGSAISSVVIQPAGAGTLFLRPNNSSTAGQVTVTPNGVLSAGTSGQTATLSLTDTGGNGCGITLNGNGSTTPNKSIRAQSGTFQWINSAYNAIIGTMDDSGNFSTNGTVNSGTSDGRVKTNFVDREPLPSHRLWYGDYDRTDTGDHGIGRVAQHVLVTHPHHVHPSKCMVVPGTDEPLLMLDRIGLAEEQGIWNGRQVDLLWAAIRDLKETRVN